MYKSNRFSQKLLFWVFFTVSAVGFGRIAVAAPSAEDFSSTPSTLSQNVAPMVLFGMSNDHQLFYKAYTDYDDLDADGIIDTSYLHAFLYYGYFDSTKCYKYSTNAKRFEPKSLADSENYCTGSSRHYWSGNYLNWATMARIDTVRKLLYGGFRSTDTATETILERTYLPNDAHSFAKFYNGDDITKLTPFDKSQTSEGLTICNTTVNNSNQDSQYVTDAPLIRVAKGDFSLWAANERWQCRWSEEKNANNANKSAQSGLNAASSNPQKSTKGLGEKDYNARIQACVTSLIGSENCKQYPVGNYKPIGLIQKYGDDDIVHFGLMTGSYTKNKSGGVLRKNVGTTTDEVNTTTNGTFKTDPTADSIIRTLNSFRLYGYSHNQGYYNDGDHCAYQLSSFVNGNCSNWGNPVAEILSECYRYYGGKNKNAAFDTDDSGRISGLKTATWVDPLSSVNKCANLNVIMLNASSISYDADELDKFDSDFKTSIEALTNAIGDSEGITGNKYFVGENGTDNNQLCTAKTVHDLGDVQGICSGAPRLEGSYKMAGAAHFSHTNDIRSLDGEQNVTTYGVALSPAVPSIAIPVPGSDTQEVKILPACRNRKNYPYTNCAIVDFKISEAYHEDPDNSGEFIGTLYVNWEDSEQGGDYDQDMWGTIKYRVDSGNITIITKVFAESTSGKMGFGYVISGTTDDGFHMHSGIEGVTFDDCSNCQVWDSATSKAYTLGGSSAELLESPLFYAAKWGGFTDLDGDKKPSSTAEWDTKNNSTGDHISDGIPDNYFLATNPSQLESQLKQVLDSIIATTASGTSAAVVSNSTSGVGAVYQALYHPQTTEGNDTVEWIGSLNGIFIDDKAHLREDANGDGILDGYDIDKIIKISYNSTLKETSFQRYSTSDNGTTLVTEGEPESLMDLKPIWSAVEQLARLTNSKVILQRSYTSAANNGRYIFTALKSASNGIVNNNDVIAFTATEMASNYRYLAIDSAKTTDLVNYIRGDDSVSNSRNRSIDYDGDGSQEVWRLGDIIHSSPVIVASPDAGYDDSHSDSSYGEFLAQYSDRRQVVYVGANDGMIHAFNAGFWDETNKQFTGSKTGLTPHPLGSELWAYIPTNLLPHLQWLKEPDYPHVYYMDGEGFSQDVKIFSDDAKHKNGWGTILVMGMRFGGGAMAIDTNGDGTTDTTTGSGYVIMDITDPESAPILLAEITAPEFGFTTSKPAIAQNRTIDNSTNKWTLVFGSGPHGSSSLTNAHSDQNARIIQVDLKKVYSNYKNSTSNNIYITGFSPTDSIATEYKSLVGDITVTDWDLNLIDDVVYFGTSSLNGTDVGGKLMRLSLATGGSVKTLVDTERPIMSTPLIGIDSTVDTNRWVMAGTGRFITQADLSDQRQQWFFGVKEPKESDGTYEYTDLVDFSDLVDTSDVRIYSDGTLLENGSAYSLGGDTITNFEEMKTGTVAEPTAGMIGQKGWKVKFDQTTGAPSGRSVGTGVSDPVNTGVLAFIEYVPPSQVCKVNGDSYIWSLSFETGTSTYYAPLGRDSTHSYNNGIEIVTASLNKIAAGSIAGDATATGLVSGLTYHTGKDGLKLIVSDSAGGISTVKVNTEAISGGQGRQSWRQIDTSNFN